MSAPLTRKVLAVRCQRGLALIAVLWTVAALSIIVTGVVQTVRNEVQLVTATRQTTVAGALGDAAIQLVLQELVTRTTRPSQLEIVNVSYQGQDITVQVMPLNGLIDINKAPEPLLASLYTVAAGLAPDAAAALAQATVETRTRKEGSRPEEGFEANEDLLRVPGLTYTAYANIARLITASQPGSGRVNPMAAPEGVLTVLAGGDVARAHRIAADRDAGIAGIDTTTLATAFIDRSTTQRFRLQARVPLPDGMAVLISRSVDMNSDTDSGLPWRTFQVEQQMDAAPAPSN